jgi:hypothetical protein
VSILARFLATIRLDLASFASYPEAKGDAMLLDDIIELATDDKQPITVLLRKCLILASQLKNELLKTWANKELNGYMDNDDDDDDLPEYRITPAQAVGFFNGPFGAQWNNMPIPPAILEEKHKQFATEVRLTQAISAYEDLGAGPPLRPL